MFIVPISQMSMKTIEQVRQASNDGQALLETNKIPFSDTFSEVLKEARETQAVSDQDAYKLAMGTVDDLHTVMINSEKATAALELTVQLTTRAINAYNEIMRMQV